MKGKRQIDVARVIFAVGIALVGGGVFFWMEALKEAHTGIEASELIIASCCGASCSLFLTGFSLLFALLVEKLVAYLRVKYGLTSYSGGFARGKEA